jgi:hypothetical protein
MHGAGSLVGWQGRDHSGCVLPAESHLLEVHVAGEERAHAEEAQEVSALQARNADAGFQVAAQSVHEHFVGSLQECVGVLPDLLQRPSAQVRPAVLVHLREAPSVRTLTRARANSRQPLPRLWPPQAETRVPSCAVCNDPLSSA